MVFEEVVSNQKFSRELIEHFQIWFRAGMRREESRLGFKDRGIRRIAAAPGDGAASSGVAPSVAAPHAPKIKMTVSVLSIPNATSFRRHENNRRHP